MAEDIDGLKGDLERVRSLMEEKSASKEGAFQKRQQIKDEMLKVIDGIKELKIKRNDLTDKVRQLKKTKLELIKKQKVLLEKLKAAQAALRNTKTGDRKMPPQVLLKKIEALDYTIETEALSPDKEKQIMVQIKQLKKEYDLVKNISESTKGYSELRKEFSSINKEINALKKVVQDDAKKSQEFHELMIQESEKVEELKKKLEENEKEFEDRRKEYLEVADQFRQIRSKLGIAIPEKKIAEKRKRQEEETQRKTEEKKEIASLRAEVMEKIKQKQKLTTEDLRILQSSDPEEEDI
jgi:uncharacterized coiled-coil DUF342 family protein